MAKAAQQTGRASGQPKARDTTPQAKTDAGGADKQVTSTDDASDNLAGFQSSQFETLRAILDKRSEDDAAPFEVAEEFATLWLPSLAVDLELLVPAVRRSRAGSVKNLGCRGAKRPDQHFARQFDSRAKLRGHDEGNPRGAFERLQQI